MSCEVFGKGEIIGIACGVNRNELGKKVDPKEIVFDSEDMTFVRVYAGIDGERVLPQWSELETIYQDGVPIFQSNHISLADIQEQFQEHGYITVWCEGPMSGTIYNWGNCLDGIWRVRGILSGYA